MCTNISPHINWDNMCISHEGFSYLATILRSHRTDICFVRLHYRQCTCHLWSLHGSKYSHHVICDASQHHRLVAKPICNDCTPLKQTDFNHLQWLHSVETNGLHCTEQFFHHCNVFHQWKHSIKLQSPVYLFIYQIFSTILISYDLTDHVHLTYLIKTVLLL